jgi:hypothetical protein
MSVNAHRTHSSHVTSKLTMNPTAWLRATRHGTPLLWWCALGLLLASLATLVLVQLDARTFNGVSVWLKPWKFQVSLMVHLMTLALVAACITPNPTLTRSVKRMSVVVFAATVFEVAYISWRASRGEASHYNVGTPVASAMYSLMGIGAVALTVCAGWLGWRVLRDREPMLPRVVQQGVGWGLIIGCVLGTLSGAYVSGRTGHWVGGTLSDANTMPIVKWSLDGGDLRVAHFFGLHAMQILPVVAWALHRTVTSQANALRAWWMVAAAYTGWTVFTFWQAWSGRPLV